MKPGPARDALSRVLNDETLTLSHLLGAVTMAMQTGHGTSHEKLLGDAVDQAVIRIFAELKTK